MRPVYRHRGRLARLALIGVMAATCRSPDQPTAVKPIPNPDQGPAVRAPRPRSDRIANYQIDARFDARGKVVRARQRLQWTNPGRSAVRELPFHLYMNAFQGPDTLFMRASGGVHRTAQANRDAPGSIEVLAIFVNDGPDVRGSARFVGPDQTVLEVPLAAPLLPGRTIEVTMEFETRLPQVLARTGYHGDFAMIGQWFPKVGVRAGAPGAETWHCEPFHANNEFFADFGTYDVELTVPATHVVAATGTLRAARDHGDGTRTLTYRAEDVHDFAWMADPFMERISDVVHTAAGPVEVRVYFRPAQRQFARRHLAAGTAAVEWFSRQLLPYPYPILSIIDPPPRAAAGAGGVEYPTLVTTGGDSVWAPSNLRWPELITIHEVAHNWFQGMIASNEVAEPWLDEGVTEYLTAVAMEHLFGPNSAVQWRGLAASAFALRRMSPPGPPVPIATASADFPDFAAFGAAVYRRTSLALRSLEAVVGRDRLLSALGSYARATAFRHPTGPDFVAELERALAQDLAWFFEPVLHGPGTVAFAIDDLDCQPQGCTVAVRNRGAVPVPVDVEVVFADGVQHRVRWDDYSMHRQFHFAHPGPLSRVTIDPDDEVVLNSTPVQSSWRGHSQWPPPPVAAASQFWSQWLLQAVGL
jgi:hypothetical protein